ncbi:hypothetical protein [Anaeropeptidivorans aminofermentans]|uniref:hypothetical protein n=1 Tax=Anaeropeptidivorans aminofermentans TaxID=2934315 RepID=UPI002023D1F1|nr:hypothetical protein [Anaeropeptidivorans aminofermentans]
MGKYLGFIEEKISVSNTFYNFKPLYQLNGTTLSYLNNNDRQELLPESEFGNINFYSSKSEYPLKEYFHNTAYIFFDFVTSELEDSISFTTGERNRTGYKVDISTLSSNKIQEMSQLNFFQVIPKEKIVGNYCVNPILEVNDVGLYDGQDVFLQIDENELIGPYKVGLRLHGKQFYVNTKLKESQYIIRGLVLNNSENDNIQVYGGYESERKIWHKPESFPIIDIDVIQDEELLQNFRDSLADDFIKDGKINLTDIVKLLDSYRKSTIIGSMVPKEIQDKRLERLRNFFTDESNLEDTFNFLSSVIPALLLKYKDSTQFSSVVSHLSNNKEFMSKVQSFREIFGRVDALKADLDELTRKKSILLEEIEIKNSSELSEEILAEHQAEIDEKIKTKDDIQKEIEKLRVELNFFENGSDLQEKLTSLERKVRYKEDRERELDKKISEIETRLDNKFKNSEDKAVDFAFDGMLANKLLKQAAAWETQQCEDAYESLIYQLRNIPKSQKRGEALVEYICEKIKDCRPNYSKNDIINILICVSQGFLTVFSGEPGTGKTSICNILAHSLGLMLPKNLLEKQKNSYEPNRYIPVSVEKGWTSKRDFVGYYNPLTRNFDKSNCRIFDGFKILDTEAKGDLTDLPFLFLLDEANLSPMEYYWADFMNICDDWDESHGINLGENYQLSIPESLRFVATINNDHTTETLSPRLLDRAWVILLPSVVPGTAKELRYNSKDIEMITWSSLKETFGSSVEPLNPMDGEAKEIYERLYALFGSLSFRVDNAIRRYWSVAKNLFENDSDGTNASIVALDYAIAQKILPLLRDSGDEYRKFLNSIYDICSDSNLRQSSTLLKSIIEKGDRRMKFYQFFS